MKVVQVLSQGVAAGACANVSPTPEATLTPTTQPSQVDTYPAHAHGGQSFMRLPVALSAALIDPLYLHFHLPS